MSVPMSTQSFGADQRHGLLAPVAVCAVLGRGVCLVTVYFARELL